MSIAVAVSGGRDSLLALALLRQAGLAPKAVHAFLARATPGGVLVGLRENCHILGVELIIADLRERFEELLVRPFVQSYLEGQTPNPCAWCNARVKFGLLLELARFHGAQRLATGHYAALRQGMAGPELWRGQDQLKDQSYFLALLTPEQLEHADFPLATLRKAEVLHRLESFGLSPALPEESQEVCFISGDYREFIAVRANPSPQPGPIVLPDGTRLGTHQGLWNYTIGQRRGLNIAWSEPLYVLTKQLRGNRLVVAPGRGMLGRGCRLEHVNLLVPLQDWPDDLFVQTRYRQTPVAIGPATRVRTSWPDLELPLSGETPAPGQLAVISSGNGQILAGAVIGSEPEDGGYCWEDKAF